MSTTPDKLVERYLKHLDVELDDLPRDRRREIVDEISGHIAEARAALPAETEADVRNILEGLGDPAEIAADAKERFEVTPQPEPRKSGAGALEIAALIMLLVGGLILPLVGWLIGVVLLWISTAWNTRDKLIGTLVVPGGLGLPLFVGFLATFSGSGGGCMEIGPVGSQRAVNTCTDQGTSATEVIAIVALAVLLLAPIITTAYLAYRVRRRPAV
jgi:uncharacterized membrane protein